LILLNRRRLSGALGWWIMLDDAVLAPTKRIADRKKAVQDANLEIKAFVFVMLVPSFK
jgi:hypothetical protein